MGRVLAQASVWRLPALAAQVSLTARPFFARFGFDVVGDAHGVVGGVAVPEVRMCKCLTPRATGVR